MGAAPTAAGPRGRARWRKESGFAMLGGEIVNATIRLSVGAAPGLPRLYNRGKDWVKLHELSALRSKVEALEPKFPVRRAKFRAKLSDKIRSKDLHLQRRKSMSFCQ